MTEELRIGVVGYSDTDFNEEKAEQLLKNKFDEVLQKHTGTPCVVSGLTYLGIPKLAYGESEVRNWKTVGVACSKAEEYEIYPVDEKIIVGSDWGDESEEFLSQIDVLVRVGGNEQAKTETQKAAENGIPIYEEDLSSE